MNRISFGLTFNLPLWAQSSGPINPAFTARLMEEYGLYVQSAAILVGWGLLYFFFRLWLLRGNLDVAHRQRIRKAVGSGGLLLVLMILVGIWFEVLAEIAFALTAFAVAFVLGFRNLIGCFVGGIYRILVRAYKMGDRVQVGDYRGIVVSIGFLATTIQELSKEEGQSTGRLLSFPHSLLLTKGVQVETRHGGFLWAEIRIKLEKPERYEEVKTFLEQIAKPHFERHNPVLQKVLSDLQENYALQPEPMEPMVYVTQKDDKPQLVLRMAVPPEEKQPTISAVLDAYYRAFPPVKEEPAPPVLPVQDPTPTVPEQGPNLQDQTPSEGHGI